MTNPATGAGALAVSAVATAAGLGVLIVSSRTHLSTLAVVLAGVTLSAAAGRSQLAFRLLARMADLRRLTAATDELTGLPNRRALYADGRARLADLPDRNHALLMLDLDKFKEVNDSLGHHVGDQLLVQIGARLNDQLRTGDLLARLGGDEFAVLLQDAGHDQAVDVAVKLRAALAEPFALQDIALYSSVSIGIALFPHDGPDLNTLLRKADVAMYKAKAIGDGHHVYGGDDDSDFTTRLHTIDELRAALTSDQLVVHYQPKIDLLTGQVHDVEALVRWDHPTRGLLYPDAFLELVEEAGLMRALTRVVLEIALDQAAVWHGEGRRLTVAVNLSASSMVDTDLPDEVATMLTARDLPPCALQMEITEEFLMADRDRARNILTRLRDSGIQISIDDFGTGYSSLSYLRDLPIDELKLDRSFILPMADDARAAALVASTIALAHSLGLRMVAEGVEDEVAYDELIRLGCDQAQGFDMSRPVPATELDVWLNTRDITDDLTEIASLLPTFD
ncbi:MAG: EAL domain-containing protein [Phycicoccus sp.]|nr:EAL domain-containing protein [Phycicoccus sp.]